MKTEARRKRKAIIKHWICPQTSKRDEKKKERKKAKCRMKKMKRDRRTLRNPGMQGSYEEKQYDEVKLVDPDKEERKRKQKERNQNVLI